MIRQIPRKRLPNQASHKYNFTNNGEKRTAGSTHSLRYIKIDERQVLKKSRDGKEIVGNAMMFYDYKNSLPKELTFAKQDLIVFNGKTYEIVDIDVLRGNNNTPHHYEIMLV